MKKTFALIICIALVMCSALTVSAVCQHEYEAEVFEASCVSREYTVYCCKYCGDTYTAAAPSYAAPDTCYMAVDGERDGDILNVSVYLGNNPGFWANRITLYYNAQALEAVSAENGDVWGSDASVKINASPESGEPYVRFYCQNSKLGDNTASGTVFKVSFNIKANVSEWGIELNAKSGDNINYNSDKVPFQIINVVSEGYGEHNFVEGSIIEAPTYDEDGLREYSCLICSETKVDAIPKLPLGDMNLDGVLDMRDSLLLKMRIADITMDANYEKGIDLNYDGKINAKDLLILKKTIA